VLPHTSYRKIFITETLGPIEMCVKFHLSISHSSRGTKGVPNFTMGVIYSFKLVPDFGVKVHALLGVDRGVSLIVH